MVIYKAAVSTLAIVLVLIMTMAVIKSTQKDKDIALVMDAIILALVIGVWL